LRLRAQRVQGLRPVRCAGARVTSSPAFPELALRLVVAMLLGGLLGLEREWKSKPAGLRTHIMVALGATCLTLVGLELHAVLADDGRQVTRVDPMRLVEGIAGGIGFLGGGAILTHRGSVEGLTTAGSIWLTGAIGLACGVGAYALAALSCGLGLATLGVLSRAEALLHAPVERKDE